MPSVKSPVVVAVDADSPAERFGVLAGDGLVALNGLVPGDIIDVNDRWLTLLGYVGLADLQASGSVLAAAKGVALVVAVFVCVVLHEYGHALTARH